MTLYISLHPGVVTHTFSPSTQKAKQDHIESPCQKKKKSKQKTTRSLHSLLSSLPSIMLTAHVRQCLSGELSMEASSHLLHSLCCPLLVIPCFQALVSRLVQLGSGNPASVKNEYLCKVPLGTELTNRRLTTKELQGLCSNLIIFNSNKSPYSFYPLTECTPSCMFFRVTVALGIETDTPRKL